MNTPAIQPRFRSDLHEQCLTSTRNCSIIEYVERRAKMAKNAPGKHYRKGISLPELIDMFATEEKAEAWFVKHRWGDVVYCPYCGSSKVRRNKNRKRMGFYCNPCRRPFTVKTGSFMHDSKLPLSKWGVGLYLYSTSLKGVSSLKLRRDLGISQKSAWHMSHRIRMLFTEAVHEKTDAEVEVDETYVGGKVSKMPLRKRAEWRAKYGGRGTQGKAAVVGMRNRETGKIQAKVVADTKKATLQGFVTDRTKDSATVYTDEARAYIGLPRNHATVNHKLEQYVDGQVTTNGMESFWATLKRGLNGTYHAVSPKHLGRYVDEFSGRHNQRELDTEDQMATLVRNGANRRLTYKDLIAD